MKSKVLIYAIATGGVLSALWLAGAFLRWRSPQIVLPASQIETAVDAVTTRQQQEAQQAQQASQDAVFQNEMLSAHAAVRSALVDWRQADGAIACARAAHLFAKWQQQSAETGKGLELVYKDELNAHLGRLRKWQQETNGTITGSPDGIAKARAMVNDTQILLALGDQLYSQQSAPLCDGSVDAEIAKLGLVYSEVAARTDNSGQRVQQLEAEQLEQARAYWQGTEPAAPAEVERPSRLYQLMFGGASDGQQ